MSVKKFKFISPGIFINEIDNSQLPAIPAPVGPVVIGRTQRGPAFLPTQVAGFSDFVEIFGNPVPGPDSVDVWRDGTPLAPTYAAYAAQAWLKNNSPCTVVRVLGDQHPQKDDAGKAGWKGAATGGGTAHSDSGGGSYALLLWNKPASESTAATGTGTSGSVAAIWHCKAGSVQLSGTTARDSYSMTAWNNSGSNVVMPSIGSEKGEFTLLVKNGSSENVEKVTFNFNKNSNRYIRKVFNTNPTLMNSSANSAGNTTAKTYFLGQTYDRLVNELVTGSSQQQYGMIVGVGDGSAVAGGSYLMGSQAGQTGWFISQDLRTTAASTDPDVTTDTVTGKKITTNQLDPLFDPTNGNIVTKLFKFHTLSGGQWEQENFKISIQDIKAPTSNSNPYGTFTILLRKIYDNDTNILEVERFSNCNLNPNSLDYVARKVGDAYTQYDTTRRRLVEYGNWPNNSRYFRIEMNTEVDAGVTDPRLLPFGVYGPPRPATFKLWQLGGQYAHGIVVQPGTLTSDFSAQAMIRVGHNTLPNGSPANHFSVNNAFKAGDGTNTLDANIQWPRPVLRVSASAGGQLSDPTEAYFGVDTTEYGSSTAFDQSYKDILYPLPVGVDSFATDEAGSTSRTDYGFVFTLDDVSGSADGSEYSWVSGSRSDGVSITAKSGSYEKILDAGYDRFTTCFHGGFDGLDILEKEPLINHRGTLSAGGNGLSSDATEKNSYAFFSMKKAIDIISDPEFVEMNLATMPGVTNNGLTTHLINTCEQRGDALAIIDLDGGYTHFWDEGTTEQNRISSSEITNVVSNLKDRSINSSYAAAYYPWVRIRDSIQGSALWAPPSIAALGVLGSSETRSAPWFAPAGFNRGGLTEGAAGIPVTGVRTKLTSKERDKLYEANINPIASFPAEGIVIFGQKTLQITPSALDRINVRRLLIFLKREISAISASILFEQNVSVTWVNFLNRVKPFLDSVKTGFGLAEYKVVLDETTTTPDLIDRNILYAKIFLKPARAIEFIAIDFTIMRTGAAFAE